MLLLKMHFQRIPPKIGGAWDEGHKGYQCPPQSSLMLLQQRWSVTVLPPNSCQGLITIQEIVPIMWKLIKEVRKHVQSNFPLLCYHLRNLFSLQNMKTFYVIPSEYESSSGSRSTSLVHLFPALIKYLKYMHVHPQCMCTCAHTHVL